MACSKPSGCLMKLCDPSMSESGGSVCQVTQRPRHSGPHSCLQTSGLHMHTHQLSHQPWVKHPAPAVASSPTALLHHRVNGAMVVSCCSPECVASRLGEEAALACRVPPGKVLVTGGAGYFGFRLGRALADQGMSVILLDMNRPPGHLPDGTVFYQVSNAESLSVLNYYLFRSCLKCIHYSEFKQVKY